MWTLCHPPFCLEAFTFESWWSCLTLLCGTYCLGLPETSRWRFLAGGLGVGAMRLGSKWRDGWFGSVTFAKCSKELKQHIFLWIYTFQSGYMQVFAPWKQMFIPLVLEMKHICLFWTDRARDLSLDSRKGFHVRIIYWRSNQVCFLPKQAKTLSSLSLFIISGSYKFQTVPMSLLILTYVWIWI